MEIGKPSLFWHLFILSHSSPLFFSDLGAIWRAGFELVCTLDLFVTTPPLLTLSLAEANGIF